MFANLLSYKTDFYAIIMPSKKRKTIAEANIGKSTRKRKQHMQGLADKKERRLRKVVRQLAKLSSILLQPMDWHILVLR